MRPGDRKLVRTIVFDAFELHQDDADARQQFIRQRCEQSPELLTVAFEEMQAEERIRAANFMERPAAAACEGTIPEGTEFGGYRIGFLIGEGAMGAVYRARQISLGRDVAIKTLRTPLASSARKRFLAEAEILSRLASRRVVHVYDYGDYNGQPYIVMEYGKGANLAEMIAARAFPDVQSKLAIALEISQALEEIHAAGVAHRDVKPTNIMVASDRTIKLIDFGIAWREDARFTEVGQVLGTPAYMSPELILRQLGGPGADVAQYKLVDIYAFGILLFELFTSTLPFAVEEKGEVEHEIVHQPLPLQRLRSEGVPEGVVDLIRRSTAKKPAARPAGFSEIAKVLQSHVSGVPSQEADFFKSALLRPAVLIPQLVAAVALAYAWWSANTPQPSIQPAAPPLVETRPKSNKERQQRDPPADVDAQPAQPLSASLAPKKEKQKPPSPSPETVTKQEYERPSPSPAPAVATPVEQPSPGPTPPPAAQLPTPTPVPQEPADEIAWRGLRETPNLAGYQNFLNRYPSSKYAGEAKRTVANLEYEAVKDSSNARLLRRFAETHPDHTFAAKARRMADDIAQRADASEEIRKTLRRYEAAFITKNLAAVKNEREMTREEAAKVSRQFAEANKEIKLTINPLGAPVASRPVSGEDPATLQPLIMTVICAVNMSYINKNGQDIIASPRGPIEFKRSPSGWKIVSMEGIK